MTLDAIRVALGFCMWRGTSAMSAPEVAAGAIEAKEGFTPVEVFGIPIRVEIHDAQAYQDRVRAQVPYGLLEWYRRLSVYDLAGVEQLSEWRRRLVSAWEQIRVEFVEGDLRPEPRVGEAFQAQATIFLGSWIPKMSVQSSTWGW